MWYDGRKEVGKRITRSRLANGKSIEQDRTYTLVVSDFMATGGSGFAMLAGVPREDIDIVDLDALIRYLSVIPAPVEAPVEARFHRTDQPGTRR